MDFETEGDCSIVSADSGENSCVPSKIFSIAEKKKIKQETKCDTELCLVTSEPFKELKGPKCTDYILKTYFKPIGPADTTEWLDNVNIEEVLDQAHEKWPEFLPLPFQMIDFADTNTELATIHIPTIAKSYNTWGVVINTDKSHVNGGRGGIHWFALFGDMRKQPWTVEYFNSSGELPLPRIRDLFKKVAEQDPDLKFVIASTFQQQHDGHSCGPYSLYYILSRLEGVPVSYFQKNTIGDKVMLKFRKFLFRSDSE